MDLARQASPPCLDNRRLEGGAQAGQDRESAAAEPATYYPRIRCRGRARLKRLRGRDPRAASDSVVLDSLL